MSNPAYRAHLKKQGNKQNIMLGFSDGTKDGGYLMANWGIYKAKERLTEMSRKYDIVVVSLTVEVHLHVEVEKHTNSMRL